MKAVASAYDERPGALLECQGHDCRFAGIPADFIDARDYPFAPSDSFDCPCCGQSDVVEITDPAHDPAVPVVDLNGKTMREIYKG